MIYQKDPAIRRTFGRGYATANALSELVGQGWQITWAFPALTEDQNRIHVVSLRSSDGSMTIAVLDNPTVRDIIRRAAS